MFSLETSICGRSFFGDSVDFQWDSKGDALLVVASCERSSTYYAMKTLFLLQCSSFGETFAVPLGKVFATFCFLLSSHMKSKQTSNQEKQVSKQARYHKSKQNKQAKQTRSSKANKQVSPPNFTRLANYRKSPKISRKLAKN